jgi:hypothetical protein
LPAPAFGLPTPRQCTGDVLPLADLPHADLIVTSDHGKVTDGYIINASALLNGDSIDCRLDIVPDTPRARRCDCWDLHYRNFQG